MKKSVLIVGLMIVTGCIQSELLGFFSHNEPYRDMPRYEAAYGRQEGIEYGRETALLGAAGAYAGYRALNWAYNRWLRNEEKHISDLLGEVKKTATKIHQLAGKIGRKPTNIGDEATKVKIEAMNRADEAANFIDLIADLYKNKNLSSSELYKLREMVINTLKARKEEKSKIKVKYLTPKTLNTSKSLSRN